MKGGAPRCRSTTTIICHIRSYMYSKDVFGGLLVSIRALYSIFDDPRVDSVGALSAPKDDTMACMASSLNTPESVTSRNFSKSQSYNQGYIKSYNLSILNLNPKKPGVNSVSPRETWSRCLEV